MMYSVAVENANVKVFDFDSGADILNESGDKWFINKNQQVIIELSSDIENISESMLITPSPEFLIIGKEYEYRLGEECIYKFWDNKNHDLSIKTNDKNIGVVVYNKSGNILYILNNDSYAYIADQEVYVRIYNNSEQVIEGNLVICDNIPILANQKISINVKGNETVLKTFECFESGVYNIISNVLENIKIDICDKNGNYVEKQYLNKYDINFLRIQNYSSYDVDLEVMVEFYPDEVTYGSNFVNSDSEFVRFTSASDEIYLLSGVDKVYDYNFNIVKLDNGRIFYDSINKYYYFKMKTNKLSISFPFETLKIGKKEIIVDNIYGLYYYSIGIDFNAEYQFLTSVQSLSILNSEYNFIDEVRVNKPISLLKGTYYLKINNKEKNGEVECILNGEPLNLGTNYVLKNDGYKIFAFIPSKAQSYHFVIQNDKNNTARCMIKVCKLVDGDFVVVYETQKETDLNESIYLGNDLYYIFVYLFDANDQQLVFFSS